MKIVAIHQPNFFPWLAFFDKMIRSDVFVILDNVQFPKKGGCWINRVKIMVNSEANFITVPVVRSYSGYRNIDEMKINNNEHWKENILKTIEFNYRKSPYFNDIFPLLRILFDIDTDSLLKFNLSVIYLLAEKLQIDASKFILASKLKSEGHATDLLISLVKSVEGNSYIYGAGAANYQENHKFKDENIKLISQDFQSPEYKQFNTKSFISGLSIIDALMNCNFENVIKLLKREKKEK